MITIALLRLDSGRHDPQSFERDRAEFLAPLRQEFELLEMNPGEAGPAAAELRVVFIASGGCEDRFRRLYPRLGRPLILLADGKHNSLPAALEISAWVRQQGETAEIVHGDNAFVSSRLRRLADFQKTRRTLRGPIGVIGKPSDWLIASVPDRGLVKKRWGTKFIDIPLRALSDYQADAAEAAALASEFVADAAQLEGVDNAALTAAARLVPALRSLFRNHRLHAATLRCFSLIDSLRTTGCLALSRLNDEGLICGCEGDVAAVFSMLLLYALTGAIPFMANPAKVDVTNRRLLLAHCSVPRRAVSAYRLQTHFETGLGVGLSGDFAPGAVTVFKAGGSGLDKYFVSGAEVLPYQPAASLCRTQVYLQLREPADYFLHNALANHHVLVSGDHAERIDDFMRHCGAARIR
ncbi:MAG: fucose isomerase [Candidatus Aminicenantes bacterium]|nr:fucose isomerase [Candidatus Aminicenantes bacterium]